MEHSGDHSLHNVPGLCCLSGCTVVWGHQRGTEEPTWTGGRQVRRKDHISYNHCIDPIYCYSLLVLSHHKK